MKNGYPFAGGLTVALMLLVSILSKLSLTDYLVLICVLFAALQLGDGRHSALKRSLIALLLAVGGGVLRDLLFFHKAIPSCIESPATLLAAISGVFIARSLPENHSFWRIWNMLESLVQTISTCIFGSVGATLAADRNLPPLGVLVVALITAVGGGLCLSILTSNWKSFHSENSFASLEGVIVISIALVCFGRNVPEASFWGFVLLVGTLKVVSLWALRTVKHKGGDD